MKTRNLSEGNPARTLLKFAAPFLLANLLQSLYGIVDMFVVGQFSTAQETAAVSVGSIITFSFNSVFIGLTTGGTVLIGQFFGAGRKEDAKKMTATMFTVLPAVAVALTVIMLAVSSPLLRLMSTPEESFASTLGYMRICLCGTVFIAGYNCLAATLRGFGDSKNPLLYVFIATVFNIVGDIVLVGVFGMGAAGAAIATVLGQAMSMILGILHISRRNFIFDFKPKSFTFDREMTKMLLRTGIPISLQDVLVNISFLLIAAVINGMGYIAAAGAGVADKLFTIAIIPSSAFSAAIAAMVAQNIGANRQDRVLSCLLAGVLFSFSVGILFFLMMLVNPQGASSLLTSDKDVVSAACEYLSGYKWEYPLCSIVFCMNGFIIGTGSTRFALINNVVSTFAVRLPLVFILGSAAGATLWHIGVALPVATAVQIIAAAVFITRGSWKTKSPART